MRIAWRFLRTAQVAAFLAPIVAICSGVSETRSNEAKSVARIHDEYERAASGTPLLDASFYAPEDHSSAHLLLFFGGIFALGALAGVDVITKAIQDGRAASAPPASVGRAVGPALQRPSLLDENALVSLDLPDHSANGQRRLKR